MDFLHIFQREAVLYGTGREETGHLDCVQIWDHLDFPSRMQEAETESTTEHKQKMQS